MYVNTTNVNLDLRQGAVSLALLKAGGTALQQECTDAAPINVGDVAVTGPGNLPCKYVLHTVVPSYTTKHAKDAEKVFRKFPLRNALFLNKSRLPSNEMQPP